MKNNFYSRVINRLVACLALKNNSRLQKLVCRTEVHGFYLSSIPINNLEPSSLSLIIFKDYFVPTIYINSNFYYFLHESR